MSGKPCAELPSLSPLIFCTAETTTNGFTSNSNSNSILVTSTTATASTVEASGDSSLGYNTRTSFGLQLFGGESQREAVEVVL